jgi:hypothetical protein
MFAEITLVQVLTAHTRQIITRLTPACGLVEMTPCGAKSAMSTKADWQYNSVQYGITKTTTQEEAKE